MAKKMVKSYSFVGNILTFAGFTITGFMKDSSIVCAMQTEAFDDDVGADGETVVWDTNDYRGMFTFSLQWSSKSNAVLSDFLNAQRTSGLKVAPATFKTGGASPTNGDEWNAPTAWVKAWPADNQYAVKPGEHKWIIKTNNMIVNLQGASAITA